jgi:hypothetical protein
MADSNHLSASMRAYAAWLLAAALVMAAACIAANILIDPYAIWHGLDGPRYLEPDARVAKMSHLIRHCGEYDSYIVGDSRSVVVSVKELGDVGARRFYNLATPSDDVASIVRRLKFLLDHGCKITTVIINESPDVILGEAGRQHLGGVFIENPAISGENRLGFYSRYLLSPQFLLSYIKARWQWPRGQMVYYPDGHADYLFHMQSEAGFDPARCGMAKVAPEDASKVLNKIAFYRTLAEMSAKNHFRTIVWIAPLNFRRSRVLQTPPVQSFLQQLKDIDGLAVVDAIGDSPMLSDYRYWHDCGHFVPQIFDELMAPAIAPLLSGHREQALAR